MVICSSSLMGRDNVLVSGEVLQGLHEIGELVTGGCAGARSLVRGPLIGAHGCGAGIRQQVDGNVGRAEQESVVSGGPDRFLAFLPCEHSHLFDRVDLVWEDIESERLNVREDPSVLHLIAPHAAGDCLESSHGVALPVQTDDGVGHLVELLGGHGEPGDLYWDQVVTSHDPLSQCPNARHQVACG